MAMKKEFDSEIEELEWLCRKNSRGIYGDTLPKMVEKRLSEELKIISDSGSAGYFLLAEKISRKSIELGYPVFVHGVYGGSLVAYFCHISDINPLPVHYFSAHNHATEEYSVNPEDYWYTCYDAKPDDL